MQDNVLLAHHGQGVPVEGGGHVGGPAGDEHERLGDAGAEVEATRELEGGEEVEGVEGGGGAGFQTGSIIRRMDTGAYSVKIIDLHCAPNC